MATLTSLSVKPWACDPPEETALKDVLARVNLERGHFRDITEASLQAEVAGDGALELSESEDEDEDEGKEGGVRTQGKPTTRQELFNAKNEMLQHVWQAEQDVLMALDFISLLMSKDAPGPANTTISPALRQQVPVATLGTEMWENMKPEKGRQAQDDLLATSVRMESLQESADSLLDAANRLQDNVRKETQYWDEILSISEKGWNVCRIPVQQHRLGVTFGFSESSAEFSRRGIAALNVSSDGTVSLDRGFGAQPKALRVLLKRGGETIGTSKVHSLPDDGETTLEARIRYARDSLFDEELYHEMVRESRSQTSLGVSMDGNAIKFTSLQTKAPDAVDLVFELTSLDDVETRSVESRAQDVMAQAVAIVARLLLTQAHRERLEKRSEVPPPLSEKKKEERSILAILRPIMSFALHQAALTDANTYIDRIAGLLSAADVAHTCERATFSFVDTADLSNAESLVTRCMQPWTSEATLALIIQDKLPLGLRIHVETTLAYGFGTTFTLTAGAQTTRFSLFDELREAVDSALASGLANALAGSAGEGWKCNVREALLTKMEGAVGGSNSAWVTVSGDSGTLSLSTPVKRVSWSGNGDSEQKSLLDTFYDIAR